MIHRSRRNGTTADSKLATATLCPMSLDNLFPYAGNHAIQNVVFAIDFVSPLSESVLKEIKKSAVKSFGNEFSAPVDQQTLAVNLGLAGPGQSVQTSVQVGGFSMQQSAGFSGLPRRIVNVSPANCVIVVNDYTRWDDVKSNADKYFDVILKLVGTSATPVAAIGLQYSDVFNWKSDPEELSLKEVFRAGSPYIVPHVFAESPPMLWHSHHGYFLDIEQPVTSRQLNNINISRVNAQNVDSIQVLTSHKVQLEKPLYKSGAENREKISDILNNLHKSNKEMLQALLTDELLSKIDLL
jgi:uncharacterized protein (TIGR04255 family)